MRVRCDGKWGYLRENGEVVVPCDYNLIGDPNAYGLIPASVTARSASSTPTDAKCFPCLFLPSFRFHATAMPGMNYGGSMMLRDEPYGGQWGLIDTLGQ